MSLNAEIQEVISASGVQPTPWPSACSYSISGNLRADSDTFSWNSATTRLKHFSSEGYSPLLCTSVPGPSCFSQDASLLEWSETFLVYLLIFQVLWCMWKLKTSCGLHRQTRLRWEVGWGAFTTGLPYAEPFPLFQISVAEVQLPQEWEEAQPVWEGTDGCSGVGAQPLSTPCLACPGKFTDKHSLVLPWPSPLCHAAFRLPLKPALSSARSPVTLLHSLCWFCRLQDKMPSF